MLTGKTRSGKTTLARQILSREKRVFAVDPKGCFKPLTNWLQKGRFAKPLYHITNDPYQVGKLLRQGHVIFRPAPDAPWDDYNAALREAWQSGVKHTLAIDEASMMCPHPLKFPVWAKAYWQQGGELGMKAIALSQRPSALPVWFFSESEQHWMFRLLLKNDRKRASEWIGDEANEGTTGLHSFFYRHVNEDDRPREYQLDLGGA